jgi:hypothetical protein
MAAATLTFPSQTLLKNVVDPVDGTDAATKTYVDGKTGSGSVAAAGSNTQIQFNNAGTIGASANLTFDYSGKILTISGNLISSNANLGNTATANFYTGDGGLLSNIIAAGGAANTVSASAQPNITSIGNLLNLQIGNLTSGPGGANGIVYFDGNGDANLSGNINATGNIKIGAGSGGSIAGANSVTANYFIGDGSQLTGVAVYFTTGTATNANFANYAGNVTESSQPNITSIGTLTSLNVSGDTSIGGNLTVDGTLTYIDSTKISLVDPILELGGGAGGGVLSANDGYDRGELLHYYTTQPIDAFMGWKNNDSQFVFGSNVSNSSGVITVNQYANVKALTFLGNVEGSSVNVTTVTGSLTTASQPNITSTGTLSSLTVSGKSNLNAVGNITITGGSTGQYLQTDGTGNLSWVTISSSVINSGTSNVKVNSDGNVTVSSGGVANVLLVSSTGVTITGDLTDIGNGTMNTLSITGTTDSANTTSGVLKVAGGVGIAKNTFVGGNLTVTGNTSVAKLTSTGNALFSGNSQFSLPVKVTSPADSTDYTTGAVILTLGGLGVYGNINAGLDVSGTTLTGPLTTASQPNITSLGTLVTLNVSGTGNISNANIGNLTVNRISNLGPAGNVHIAGGTAGQYLSTDGAGNLSWESAASTNKIVNGTSNVTVNNDGNVTISSDGTANVLLVNNTNVIVNGVLTTPDLIVSNLISVTSTTDSTLYTNGALTIAGGLGVAGNIVTNSNLAIAGNIHATDLMLTGNSTVQGNAEFQKLVSLTAPTDSINSTTGALQITRGGLGVYGNIYSGQGITGVTLTGSLTTGSQPNITSIGTLSSLSVSGNITAGNVGGANLISASYLTGTLTTGNQSNITTVGTLGNLAVTSNTSTGNLTVTGNTNLGAAGNITITGGSSGQYLQTDGAGVVSWKSVSTSALVNGNSNIVINPNGNINLSSTGSANVVQVTNSQVIVGTTTESTSYTTGALLVNGGVGIAGNLFINGLLNVSGDFQVGNLNTSGPVAHTGEVSFTQTSYFTNSAASTNTTSGAVQITGGLGVQGNIYGGNIISSANTILRNGRNVPTFVSSVTMPSSPLLGDEWYDQANDRIYQYIYDGSNYNWIDVSGGYIAANVQAQGGTLVVRDNNGNIYGNVIHAEELDVTNLVITGTTSISSMASAGAGKPVSNTTDTIIDQFPKTLYRSAKYIISARNDDGYEVLEALLIHDDGISYIQTYGDLTVGNPNSLLDVTDIVTLSSNIVGGNVRLYATGSNSNTFVNLVSTYVTD